MTAANLSCRAVGWPPGELDAVHWILLAAGWCWLERPDRLALMPLQAALERHAVLHGLLGDVIAGLL